MIDTTNMQCTFTKAVNMLFTFNYSYILYVPTTLMVFVSNDEDKTVRLGDDNLTGISMERFCSINKLHIHKNVWRPMP